MKATHFIELVKGNSGLFYDSMEIIEHLENNLSATVDCGFTTIAIWKIKFK